MEDDFDSALAAWRLVDAQAQDMESKVAQTWEQFKSTGIQPSEDLLQELSRLRAEADGKLMALVARGRKQR